MGFKSLTKDKLSELPLTEFLARQSENEKKIQELQLKIVASPLRDCDGNSLIPNNINRNDIKELKEREEYSQLFETLLRDRVDKGEVKFSVLRTA